MGLKKGGIDLLAVLRREKREGVCDFAGDLLQRAKTQPIRKILGDATELLSRTVINATGVVVATTMIAIAIENGVAIAAGTMGVVTAQKFFEPLVFSINHDGTAVVEAAASSGMSVWQVIAASLGQAAAAFTGLVEAAGHLFCAMERPYSGLEKKFDFKMMKIEEKQLQKKYKHAIDFGVEGSWNKNAASIYRKAILDFMNSEEIEIMHALYRKESATFYINKKTRLFVVVIEGKYRTGWKLAKDQLNAFLRSGNLY